MNRKVIAAHTLGSLKQGYLEVCGQHFDLNANLETAKAATQLFLGAEPELEFTPERQFETRFDVRNETSLEAMERLARAGDDEVLCLNFASANTNSVK